MIIGAKLHRSVYYHDLKPFTAHFIDVVALIVEGSNKTNALQKPA